jgi:adenylyltransferase/sulfurtransferase
VSDEMNDEQLLRYSRQIMLSQFDIEGQQKLLASHVLIVGAGGLGVPCAMYLASAGVGRLTLVDDDSVEITNLQRQVAFETNQLGEAKVTALKQQLLANNPECQVDIVNRRLQREELDQLLKGVDAVADATDNFTARFMINQACWQASVPLISAAAIQFEGQLSVYDPRQQDSPCYKCLYGEMTDEALSCSQAGILGPVVGSLGVLQALEVIKVIAGMGQPLVGRLQIFDALRHEWRTIKLKKDPECPVCSI